MRLKRIKLAGFKSFVDPTSISFPGEMTAIVGPNGCGKSNVIDAVRWVLGESSAKNLRGDAMTDVIFNGSSARKPVGQCSVELVFDNSSGRITGEYAAYNELAVKRVVTRDAQSFYYLNNSKCRRRDVTDLFLGTGLGPRSYAIIEQGMISRLIESKPQELRVFIEEAAGVSKYKERRKETLTRIKHTQENLERLSDVRIELGQQLDKLQRQAAAARRYTEYKAQQRQLQGELLALRWSKQASLIEQSQRHIAVLETEYEAQRSEKVGDASVLLQLQTEQDSIQAELQRLQEQKFQLATQISRLEQDQKYQQTRREELQRELQLARETCQQLQGILTDYSSEEAQLQSVLAEYEPEYALLEAQFDEALAHQQHVQNRLATFQTTTHAQAQAFQQVQQQLAHGHSQIQASLSVQMTIQTRLQEVQQQLSEQHTQRQAQLEAVTQLEEEQRVIDADVANIQDALCIAQKTFEELEIEHQQAQSDVRQLEQNKLSQQAQYDALLTIQDNQISQLPQALQGDCQALWEWLTVKEDIEPAVLQQLEHVLHTYGQPYVSCLSSEALLAKIKQAQLDVTGLRFVFEENFTADKPDASLASFCLNPSTPKFLHSISSMPGEIKHRHDNTAVFLDEQFLVLNGMLVCLGEQRDSHLHRVQTLNALRRALDGLATEIDAATDAAQQAHTALQTAQSQRDALQRSLQSQLSEQQKIERLAEQARFVLQQTDTTLAGLSRTQDDVTEQLNEQEVQLETLNEQVAIWAEEVAEQESQQRELSEEKAALEQALHAAKTAEQQLQSQRHQAELVLQQQRSQLQFLTQNMADKAEQLTIAQEQAQSLADALEQCLLPAEEHAEQLQLLLAQQVELEHTLQETQTHLVQIHEQIKETELGQQGVQQKLQVIQDKIQAEKLSLEGHNVRAASIVEQLQQHNVALKDILPTLTDEMSESQWQVDLDSVTQKIQRLGAVNLAAVEEYAVQAERKAHLDQQHEDLAAALETLETAMRKMDNETKARFKSTFDQVNGDLQMLFPKVFGGGAAYLELTGDDMLETGVTIMARPPGKKNSTIHLLSGGEKALTALSLVFAIFRLNPAPFCLLDEVDAPLDDANVGRFCKLVSEMSKTVQFIYISHNKIAMEMASHLTGVTMGEPGVSRMVAVDIEEAVAITQL